MRAARFTLCIWLATVGIASAKLDPAHWSLELQPTAAPPGSKILARLEAKLDAGWHLYSLTTPRGGPNPTTIHLTDNPAVETFQVFEPPPKRAFDPNFNLDTETYEGGAAFLIEVELKKDAAAGPSEITAAVRYQACNDRLCLPPQTRTAAATLKIDPSASAASVAIPAGYTEVKAWRGNRCRCRSLWTRQADRRLSGSRPVPAHRLRLRLGGDLHAMRFSHDSDHHVVLPEPAIGITA